MKPWHRRLDRYLERRLSPPLVALAAGVAVLLLPSSVASARASLGPRAFSVILAVIGVGLCVASIVELRSARSCSSARGGGEVPFLAEWGVYGLTRNPMYLGFLTMLTALSVFLMKPFALGVLSVFVAYLNRYQILPEEAMLRAQFGPFFEEYTARVRRWI